MRGTSGLLVLLGLSVLLTFACGSAPPAAATTINLTQTDAGKTVQARVGDTLRVTLEETFPVPGSSLVWKVSSSNASILAPGATTGQPSPGPGVKQFTYQADFAASAAGQAVLQAHGYTSCEAMAKPSCPDQEFTISVTVSA